MHKSIIVIAVLALSACSTTNGNGIRFFVGTGESDNQNKAAIARGERVAPELDVLAVEWARHSAPDVIVIGDIGTLNALDATQMRAFHQRYANALAQRQSGYRLAGNADDFASGMGGWSSIETYGWAGILRLERPAAVRAADIPAIGFVGGTSSLFGATGDLVAARGDRDGMLVVDKQDGKRIDPASYAVLPSGLPSSALLPSTLLPSGGVQ